MALHKKNKIQLILLTLLLFTIFSSLQIRNVLTSSTVSYTFNSTEVYNKVNPSFNSTYNIRNQTSIIPANWSDTTNMETFTDDTPAGNPAGWTITEGTGCTVNVIASKENHDMVLQLYDNHAGATSSASALYQFQEFPREYPFTVEFWILMDGGTENRYISFWEDDTMTVGNNLMYMSGGDFYNQDDEVIGDYDNNIWYHIAIFVNAPMDLYSIRINSMLVSALDSMNIDMSWAECFVISTRGWGNTNYYLYLDAWGVEIDTYSNYTLGENIFPSISTSDITEIDKWEFLYDTSGNPVSMGSNNIPFWDTTAGNLNISPQWTNDGASILFNSFETHDTIEHIFSENYGYINVNFTAGFFSHQDTGDDHYYDFNIYSIDSTLIVRLRLFGESTLDWTYYDGIDYHILYADFHTLLDPVGDSVYFNLLLVNESVYITSSLFNTTAISKINPAKEGLSKIEIDTYAIGGSGGTNMYLDSVGCYIDGVSITQDVATYSLTGISWNLEHPTFIEFNATGYFSFSYTSEIPQHLSILGFSDYAGYNRFFDDYITTYNSESGKIVFTSNESFTVDSLNIYQIYLTGVSNYYIDFEYSGTSANESYFYVDSSHRLRFSLMFNDNNSEYMEAIFNIPNLLTENYSASFLSNIDGNGYGFFRLSYSDDTSTFLEMPAWLTTTNMILPQTREIITISILITDNDNFYSGVCSGLISTIQLIYIRDIRVQITTLNLMMVIVPIIVLLVPTFGISARYGKNTILPVFILMSIICFATSLIPIWVFFIIMLSAGAFLFMKRKGGDN